MQKNNRSMDWLKQAKSDFQFAKMALEKQYPIVIWSKPAPWTLPKLIRLLRKDLMGKVQKAFLFGSYAEGKASEDSDIDLMLVVPSSLPWPERGRSFHHLQKKYGEMDLLIYTPKEWFRLLQHPTQFFRKIQKTWKKIL